MTSLNQTNLTICLGDGFSSSLLDINIGVPKGMY